jgi:Mn2+/Fe2+ NRAMP family transporter
MLADTDAGNEVAGAQWGYRLLPLPLLIPMLYMVQELTVRLGIHAGRGHGELIRERFGMGWAWPSTAGLAAATRTALRLGRGTFRRDRGCCRPSERRPDADRSRAD